MKRAVLVVFLLLLLGFMGRELYAFYGERSELTRRLDGVNTDIGKLEAENKNLESDVQYYSNPDNLAKEARSEFNYKAPGEKTIIVVPKPR